MLMTKLLYWWVFPCNNRLLTSHTCHQHLKVVTYINRLQLPSPTSLWKNKIVLHLLALVSLFVNSLVWWPNYTCDLCRIYCIWSSKWISHLTLWRSTSQDFFKLSHKPALKWGTSKYSMLGQSKPYA